MTEMTELRYFEVEGVFSNRVGNTNFYDLFGDGILLSSEDRRSVY